MMKLYYADAMEQGYVSMTKPYHINAKDPELAARERTWFERVLHDMRGAKIVIVEFTSGLEIWRHKSELNIDPTTGKTVGTGSLSTHMKGIKSYIEQTTWNKHGCQRPAGS